MVTDFLHSFDLEPGIWDICLRLLCAMVVGLVIGTEREYSNRPAGMRTHILVALGACVVSITGQMIFYEYRAMGGTPDPARLSAQVITGVGFLGAGTILREGATVKGLTTAASLWTVACLGTACGYGYYTIALAGMIFMLITLTILELLQHHLPGRVPEMVKYELHTHDIVAALKVIDAVAQSQRAHILETLAEKTDAGHILRFQATFPGIHSRKRSEQFFASLVAAPECESLNRDATAV
ncbi:MAG: MgtC/SapB family protein [Ruminococcaceae bacterium]|nr:MgtC/SapB family protein [Oscillospiraceae bacterium]MBQ3214840.1 MgtC/SapB family protein [Oscillospiraceae bacterium]